MRSLLRSVFVSAASLLLATAAQATNVSGPILSDTSWNLAGSPYTVIGDVVVMPGVTLTIDPNVQVKFNPGLKLRAQGGVISAVGSPGNQIAFTSANISNPGLGVELAPSGVTGGIFTHCVFANMTAGIIIGCCGGTIPVVATNCIFNGNATGVTGYNGAQAQFISCQFTGNTLAVDTADKTFTNCTFSSNASNTAGIERMTFQGCTINGGTNGISGSGNAYNVFIYDTKVSGCVTGVFTPTKMERCEISFNQTGLRIVAPPQSVQCCDFFGNSPWNVESSTPITVTFANNWWGTVSTPSIDARIKDGNDMAGLGYVLYNPVLTGSYTTGPCQCTTPVISANPLSMTKFSGTTVQFVAGGTGTAPLSYQWLYNGQPIAPNPRFTGVNTSTLTINPIGRSGTEATWTDSGAYSCRISNLCGYADTTPAFLTVNNCVADVNNMSGVTPQDIFDFLAAWYGGCP